MLASLTLTLVLAAWQPPRVVRGTIDGKPGEGRALVYLPARCTAKSPCPLVLALHGWGHSPELWREKGDLGPLAEQHGVVLVVPDLGKTVYESVLPPGHRGQWTTAPGLRWVAEVVFPWARALPEVRKGRAHTSVIGYSTGGRGALLLAEQLPEFHFAASLSGTYDLLTLPPGDGEYRIHAAVYGPRAAHRARWETDNVVNPKRLASLEGTRVYAAHGANDRVVKPDQLEALRAAHPGAELVLVPGAGHDWAFWNAQWPQVFSRAE